MSIIVQKYGGSSVATVDKMRKVAQKIVLKKQEGYDLVIVVSAMGNTTNQLLDMAKEITHNPSKRELDMLMSTGEQISISLLSMILQEMGYETIALTGFQAGIKTDNTHTKSRIVDIDINKLKMHLESGKIIVVAGFQGINEDGDITTLGRGGSDTTAVALAAKLQCKCEIYTDVEGIYSVDPRLHSKAKKLKYIGYEEMMEMSSLGAKVMEARSVEIGYRYGVSIYVASSMKDVKGTYIKEVDNDMELRSITGLTVNDDVLMVTINNVPYSAKNISNIFEKMASQNVNIDMISQTSPRSGAVNVSFTTSLENNFSIDKIMNQLMKEFKAIEVIKDNNISKISVIGMGMREQSGVAAKVFKIFANHDIQFKQVTTSEISISYTILNKDKMRAVSIIAEAFNL